MTSSLALEETSERTFERLYRRHRGDVYRFVLRDLRNPDDAEDVTQAAFLNAYRALQRGSEPEKPRAWLFTIAQNVTRRRFRSRAAHPYEVELDPEALVAPQSDAPSAAEIRDALRRLRPNQRAVIVLREIGGLSYAEIAETLGLSVSAVETLLFRSRRALREELAAAEEQSAVVRVGGLVLWPLPAALSDAAGSVAAWLGRRALTVKVAGAAGAAVLGTGVAIQAGAIPLSGPERSPEPASPAAVTPAADVPAAGPARSTVAKPKRERAPATDGPDRSAPERAAPSGDTRSAGLVGELTEAPLPQVPLPQVSVPQAPLPSAPLPEAPLPAVSVPEPSVATPTLPTVPEPALPETPPLPVLPDPQLPPLPDADDLLP